MSLFFSLNKKESLPTLPGPTWEEISIPGLEIRKDYTATAFKEYIVLFGGMSVPRTEDPNHSLLMGPGYTKSNDITLLDPKNNKFYPLKVSGSIPEPRYGHSACFYKDNQIVVFGGADKYVTPLANSLGPTDEVAIITLDTVKEFRAEWKVVKSEDRMRFGRQYHSTNIFKNEMYIFGGIDGKRGISNELLKLNLDTLQWGLFQCSGSGPGFRFRHSSLLHGHKIYVYGGKGKEHDTFGSCLPQMNSLHILDLTSLEWEEVRLQKSIRFYDLDSMQLIGSSIYILGMDIQGPNRKLKDCYVYDIKNGNWKRLDLQGECPIADTQHCLIHCQDKLVLVGGTEKFEKFNIYSIKINSEEIASKHEIETTKNNTNNNITRGSNEVFISQIKKLFLQKTYFDVTFTLQDQKLSAHKNILAARCKYFANMFSSGMIESNESNIEVPDIPYITFKAVLEFVYCNELELDYSLAMDLLKVSDKYSFDELKKVCEKFLSQQLNLDNYVAVADGAEKFDAALLRSSVVEFVIKNKQLIEKKGEPGDLSQALLWEIIFKMNPK